MKQRLLFDTHASLAYINREEGSEIINALMDEIQIDEKEGLITSITRMDLVSRFRLCRVYRIFQSQQ